MSWRQTGLLGLLVTSVAVAIVAGCGPGDGDSDPDPSPSGSPSATTPEPSPTWSPSTSCTPLLPAQLSVIQTQLFDGGCLSTGLLTCHTGRPPDANLALSSGMTLVETSNIASAQIPTMVLVAPGSREDSYLYLKLIGDPVIYTASGLSYPMPNTGEPLSQCAIDTIGDWIDAGAMND